jgi:hypothetical protein
VSARSDLSLEPRVNLSTRKRVAGGWFCDVHITGTTCHCSCDTARTAPFIVSPTLLRTLPERRHLATAPERELVPDRAHRRRVLAARRERSAHEQQSDVVAGQRLHERARPRVPDRDGRRREREQVRVVQGWGPVNAHVRARALALLTEARRGLARGPLQQEVRPCAVAALVDVEREAWSAGKHAEPGRRGRPSNTRS